MEAEMSMSTGGFDQALGETDGEMVLSVLDNFEISMNIGKHSDFTKCGVSRRSDCKVPQVTRSRRVKIMMMRSFRRWD